MNYAKSSRTILLGGIEMIEVQRGDNRLPQGTIPPGPYLASCDALDFEIASALVDLIGYHNLSDEHDRAQNPSCAWSFERDTAQFDEQSFRNLLAPVDATDSTSATHSGVPSLVCAVEEITRHQSERSAAIYRQRLALSEALARHMMSCVDRARFTGRQPD